MKSIKFNFVMNMLLTVSSVLFPVITFPYVSRVLKADGLGKVSFAVSVLTYFSMLAQLGIPTYGIRTCAKVKDDKEKLSKTVHEIFIINFVMTCLSYILFLFALFFIDKFRMNASLMVITSLTMVFNMLGMSWLYSALEQYAYITFRSLVFKLISLISMFLLVRQVDDYILYAAITVFAGVGSNVINFIHGRKFVTFKPFEHYEFRKHLKPVFVFFSMSVASTVYTSMDTVMLGFLRTDSEVGYYNAAVKIRLILLGVVNSLATVLLPRASYYIEHGQRDKFIHISQKAFHFVVIFASPFWIFFTLFARESIIFISGTAYLPSVVPMQLIMPTVLICGLSNMAGIQMLVPLGREKMVLISQIAGAAIDFLLNLFLIPYFGASAAAFSTMFAEFMILMIQMGILLKEKISLFGNITFFKIAIGMTAGILASLWTKQIQMNSFLSVCISSVCFFGAYGAVLMVLKEKMTLEIKNMGIGLLKARLYRESTKSNHK